MSLECYKDEREAYRKSSTVVALGTGGILVCLVPGPGKVDPPKRCTRTM